MQEIPEYIDGIPNIAGREKLIDDVLRNAAGKAQFLPDSRIDFAGIDSAAAIALHMHQPLIPAGGSDLATAEIISNLKYMMDNQGIGDNHNAPTFQWCYRRLGEFIPQLVAEGMQPRVMLEYSGTLLHGLRQMGAHDVIDALKTITLDSSYRQCVEWLGAPWGHAVAPSTPTQDFRLHVRAWQHHFAAIFGLEALTRVRGFSPSEMALPNHPDVAYEYIKTLVDCGYEWLLVQEHTVEQPETGHGPEQKHLPHRLVCTNSKGDTVSIIAVLKTQGSDTKLVAQMQPWYEAKSLQRWTLAGQSVPPVVTQIADGENGGVMMNEFPGKFMDVARAASGSQTPLVNVTEYLEYLASIGLGKDDFPTVQPIFQKAIWDRFTPGGGSGKLEEIIETLRKEDHRFHMEGGSWTSDISWVKGYDDVLNDMEQASAVFSQRVLNSAHDTDDHRYRNALFHLLTSQTSCYRYWGQGQWTDYGREICRRTKAIVENDF